MEKNTIIKIASKNLKPGLKI